jgi:hypothetical protein
MDRFDADSTGFTSSVVYRRYDNALDAYVWVVDVDLEVASSNPNANPLEPLIAVPVDDPSRSVYSADIGTQVNLRRRREDNRYVVSGLSKYAAGTLSVCLVQLTPCGTALTSIGNPVLFGNTIRPLNYDEIGTPALNGGFAYGEIPYGASGKFDIDGNLIKLIT